MTTFTSDEQQYESDPTATLKWVHLVLTTQLGLPSPLAPAVALLDRLQAVDLAKLGGMEAVTRNRETLARAIATGERDFDDDAVREWADGGLWVAGFEAGYGNYVPPASSLSTAVARAAQREAAHLFTVNAAAIFTTLQTAARDEVAKLEALPKPPRGLWVAGDPTQLLVRTAEHAETLSTLAFVDDRFWVLQRLADVVRSPAGFGFERYPDGAPRLAAVYRRWPKALDEEGAMASTHKSLRLWRAVVDGWQPGVWRPEDIKTTPADSSFSAKLQRFGFAVGRPSGLPTP
jgi:hypothetical protein